MHSDKLLLVQNLNFNFEETKKKVNDYFIYLEKLEWELAKINVQKGLTANYDFSTDYKKQAFIPIGKDEFALRLKEEQLKKYVSNYYWARSVLSDKEQTYIAECLINRKYEDEIVDLVDCKNSDSIRIYPLCETCSGKVAVLGYRPALVTETKVVVI